MVDALLKFALMGEIYAQAFGRVPFFGPSSASC